MLRPFSAAGGRTSRGRHGGGELFLVFSFSAFRSSNLTNMHLLSERKTSGGPENGGVGAFTALRCAACIGAPPHAVNPERDTFTGFKGVTKMDGGQRGGREVTELLS